MFLGLSYLFEGDLIKGIEHLLIAKRITENIKVIEIANTPSTPYPYLVGKK